MECKYEANGEAKDFNDELIDTLWNVNWTYQDDKGQWHRINRYIMECKFPSYQYHISPYLN